jgi:hypothetical protein
MHATYTTYAEALDGMVIELQQADDAGFEQRRMAFGERADPLIGLAITGVILKITWDSWRTDRLLREAGWTVVRAWEHDATEAIASRVEVAVAGSAVGRPRAARC